MKKGESKISDEERHDYKEKYNKYIRKKNKE